MVTTANSANDSSSRRSNRVKAAATKTKEADATTAAKKAGKKAGKKAVPPKVLATVTNIEKDACTPGAPKKKGRPRKDTQTSNSATQENQEPTTTTTTTTKAKGTGQAQKQKRSAKAKEGNTETPSSGPSPSVRREEQDTPNPSQGMPNNVEDLHAELRRLKDQVQSLKQKNSTLTQAQTAPSAPRLIPKPNKTDFCLQAAMGLSENNLLYNRLRSMVREETRRAGIDHSLLWHQQDFVKLAHVKQLVLLQETYFKKYDHEWPIPEFIRRYLKHQRAYAKERDKQEAAAAKAAQTTPSADRDDSGDHGEEQDSGEQRAGADSDEEEQEEQEEEEEEQEDVDDEQPDDDEFGMDVDAED